jgi:S-formylglutathione hydrolase FrmB
MISNQVNFYSDTLASRCSMNVLLPQRKVREAHQNYHPPFRVLYLLHGYSDDHLVWHHRTSIEWYAEGLNLAVVMPSVQNSFYTDMAHGGKYFTFLTEELPSLLHELFPISTKREETFVAGLSMGGYGAFKLAFSRPDLYAAAASLSGAVDIRERVKVNDEPNNQAWLDNMRNNFGDLAKISGSPHDLFELVHLCSPLAVKPRLFQCCGTEDFLYADNIRFRDLIQSLGFDYTYTESSGDHRWEYWDMMIQEVLAWLCLKPNPQS